MTTYNWADQSLVNPTRAKLQLVSNTAVLRSVLTGSVQTVSRPGTRWEYELTWENLSGDERRDLLAFFARLNGAEHRVSLPMFDDANRGAWSGTPLVDGAAQTGVSLNCDGAPASVTDYAKAGDFFRFDNAMRMCTTDADSDGSGDFTLNFVPPIRTSPANDAAIVQGTATAGVYILVTPISFDVRDILASGNRLSSLSLSFVDDLAA